MSNLTEVQDKVCRAQALTNAAFMATQWMEAGMEREALATTLDTISAILREAVEDLKAACMTKESRYV